MINLINSDNKLLFNKSDKPLLQPQPLEHYASEKDRGLILLQIDGLSYESLLKSIDKGYAPNLKKIIESGNYNLKNYFCGLQSITTPILSTIFYGVEIPGDEWFDKSKKKFFSSYDGESQIKKEGELKGEKGLLYDGSSYSSPFTGGTSEMAFNLGGIHMDREKHGWIKALWNELKRETGILNCGAWGYAKLLFQTVFEFCKEFKALRSKRPLYTLRDYVFPFTIVSSDIVALKIAEKGVKNTIDRGLPITYVDTVGYDAVAHYFGPDSDRSFESLKLTDEKIGEIFKKIEDEKKPYDVVVFSDHGQTEALSFKLVNGKTLQDTIIDMAGNSNSQHSVKKGDIEVSTIHSISKVYLNFKREIVSKDEINEKYPNLLEKLIQHPSIACIAVRTAGGIVIEGKNGKIVQKGDGFENEGDDPLEYTGLSKILAGQIADFLKIKNSGDILLFGTYKDGKVIDFDKRYTMTSTHGGVGGKQMNPFILYGKDVGFEPEKIKTSKDFFEQLKKVKKDR